MHFTSGVGELLEVGSEDVVGKHLAECVGFRRGGRDPGSQGPCGHESAGHAKLRLPTPQACVAGTHELEPLTLKCL